MPCWIYFPVKSNFHVNSIHVPFIVLPIFFILTYLVLVPTYVPTYVTCLHTKLWFVYIYCIIISAEISIHREYKWTKKLMKTRWPTTFTSVVTASNYSCWVIKFSPTKCFQVIIRGHKIIWEICWKKGRNKNKKTAQLNTTVFLVKRWTEFRYCSFGFIEVAVNKSFIKSAFHWCIFLNFVKFSKHF